MRLCRHIALTLAALLVSVPVLAQGPSTSLPAAGGTLEIVRSRGQLVCGVYGTVAGFSLLDSRGQMNGLDADMCRAVAAAVFGDATKVKFVPLSGIQRFPALQSGEIDLLVRETTWTTTRESSLGLMFAGVNFYDGTGFVVRAASGVKAAADLNGATICVAPGTSTELAVSDFFNQHNLRFTPVVIDDLNSIQQTFLSSRCGAYSTDRSNLASFRAQQAKPDDFLLLPEVISKEPLGPVVRKGDDKWFDVVRWSLFAQIAAEELGITSQNVEANETSKNPDVRRLLGKEGNIGQTLGLDSRWALNIIKQVGNYGEMYERDIAPLAIPRGINNLWNNGGLQFAPPIR